MVDSLRSLGTRGAKLIRLDAFGYATKTPGTRCFFQVSPAIAFGLRQGCQQTDSSTDSGQRLSSSVIVDT